MSFVTVEFAIFFAIVLPLYFVTPHRLRWVLLLAASYYFYGFWNVNYLALIIFSTVVDYTIALLIDRIPQENDRPRRNLLFLSVMMNMTVLFTFKYFNFFSESFAAGVQIFNPDFNPVLINVLLPVGISFYTFQSLAYTIDVYRGKVPAERHFGLFATYIAFFPQLVAGPIERAQNMLPQFHARMHFDPERILSGFQLILWGLFKKIVIADRLAAYVNPVFSDIQSFDGPSIAVATFFFAFQVYCDFSAYSDIAIGLARMMGFDLMQNFRQPWVARSVGDFWARWHISLLTWFRDYIYIPLGGSRVSLPRHLFNVMVIFVVSGLWHGAGWNFVVWGIANGIMLVIETAMRRQNVALFPASMPERVKVPLQTIGTTTLITITFLIFRSESLADMAYGFTHLLNLNAANGVLFAAQTGILPPTLELLVLFGLIAFLLVIDYIDSKTGFIDNFQATVPAWMRLPAYGTLGAALLLVIVFYTETAAPEFFYFQF